MLPRHPICNADADSIGKQAPMNVISVFLHLGHQDSGLHIIMLRTNDNKNSLYHNERKKKAYMTQAGPLHVIRSMQQSDGSSATLCTSPSPNACKVRSRGIGCQILRLPYNRVLLRSII